jgi:biopolymer transport protein ExbD
MAFSRRKKEERPKGLGLLPFMNLFAILIPFLLSVAVFERLGMLELNLPDRPIEPIDTPEPLTMKLTVVITDEYLTIGADGGFRPRYYYDEEVQYRSRSDGHVFLRKWVKGEEVKSPTDGRVMTPFEKEVIHLHMLNKKDSADAGRYIMVAANSLDEPAIDSTGEWFTRIPAPGEKFQIMGDQSLRTMAARDSHLYRMKKLSAYDEVARDLWKMYRSLSAKQEPPADMDKCSILADSDIIYDKVIHIMDAAKYAGFSDISLTLLTGGDKNG